jgi:hypothetical protein
MRLILKECLHSLHRNSQALQWIHRLLQLLLAKDQIRWALCGYPRSIHL